MKVNHKNTLRSKSHNKYQTYILILTKKERLEKNVHAAKAKEENIKKKAAPIGCQPSDFNQMLTGVTPIERLLL
jgi:tRNA U34 2-thiouridine synthase MnmA/TrmU